MQTLAGKETAAVLVWEAPGKPVSVRLSYDTLDGILREAMRGLALLPRRGAEVGGLLLGAIGPGPAHVVRIDDFLPLPIEYAFGPSFILSQNDHAALREALARQNAVGFYRSHTRDGLALGEEDLGLFSTYFTLPGQVALLVRPYTMRPSRAGFFFREGELIHAAASYQEFDCQLGTRPAAEAAPAPEPEPRLHARPAPAPELELRPPARPVPAPEPPPPPAHQPEAALPPEPAPEAPQEVVLPPAPDIPLPSFLAGPPPKPPKEKKQKKQRKAKPPPKPRVHPLWASWLVQVPLLALLLSADGFLGFVAARQVGRHSTLAAPARDPYALSMIVLEYGDNLHLTWDRNAPAVASAQSGALYINDGDQARRLDLSPAELRFGSVMYRRLAGPVRFRLEIYLKGRRSVSETWDSGSSPKP